MQQQLREIIPWPVKSHQYKDVTEDSIKLFLTKAPPADYDYSKKLALFNAECLKWHADRIPRLFGSIDDPSLTTFFHIVSQVAIKMRAEVAREQK